VNIASETDFDESKPLQTETLTEGMRADFESQTQWNQNHCRRKPDKTKKPNFAKSGTQPKDSNPDLKTKQITETAAAQRPNLINPKLNL